MSTLTKADITEAVYNKVGFSKREAILFVETFFDMIKDQILAGKSVKITGFGTFNVRKKQPRRGRNPKTGQEMILPGRYVVTFKPSRILRDAINGKDIPKFLLEENFIEKEKGSRA